MVASASYRVEDPKFPPRRDVFRLYPMMLRILTTLVLAVAPSLPAQIPGTRITVDVTVKSLVIVGDTVTVTYSLYNRPTSRDSLYTFTVDAPARVKSIPTPRPETSYDADSIYHDRPMADWAFLNLLPPGATSVALTFQSVGLPSIVKDWIGGHYPLVEESASDSLDADPLRHRSVPGKTVGVSPWPANRTPRALIARLRTLTQTGCAAPLRWITSSTVCAKLIGYLDQAETNSVAGKRTQAQSSMNSYITLLSAETAGTFASGVTNHGYWLLKPNAVIILGRL